ncbi:hypothetical protein [Streptomyces sp. DH37]|uniref:hypothetical protein n=1 Tax=Streptomyces sp. DH37 TaxID=3040122 RepID=UPI002441B014|nr:hypothetical protein [Streptomyces sp. DH37]MDG9700710.1 hypothetical protein [Streptomyces sp. DH37]
MATTSHRSASGERPAGGRRPAFPFGLWKRRPAPRLTTDFGDPGLARLREAARAGDWPAVRERLASAADGDELCRLVWHVSDTPGMAAWMGGVLEREPDGTLALLTAGAHHVQWAWEARTGARASQVSREQFRIFHQRLEVAEDLLYRVAEREPDWVAPWFMLQVSGRGLQVGREIARLRFEATVRRSPGHLGAHRQHLQQVCAKWGGSHEEMHAFARDSMLAAPEGSPLGELVALAHLEHWLDLEPGQDAEYIGRPDVRAQLLEAADRSIGHPAFGRPSDWIGVHNTFAMALSLAGERGAAAAAFAPLDGQVTEFPWQYLDSGDPVAAFRKWRSRAGR